MTDYADISTFANVQTKLATHASISSAEIIEMKEGKLKWKDTQYYSVDMVGIPATEEGIGNTSREFNNMINIYIRASSEANFYQRASYIEDIWTAGSIANKFNDFLGMEKIGWRGKVYLGYVSIKETIFNVVSGYTP